MHTLYVQLYIRCVRLRVGVCARVRARESERACVCARACMHACVRVIITNYQHVLKCVIENTFVFHFRKWSIASRYTSV